MTDTDTLVIGGVDAHHDTQHAVALDDRGQRLGDAEFPVNSSGYQQLHDWVAGFGTIIAVGIESTGNYAAGLTRFLLAVQVALVEINQPHAHLRHHRGKTDAIDAEAAARKVLSGEGHRPAQGHHWHRRGHPTTQDRAPIGRQGTICCARAARATDRHRPG